MKYKMVVADFDWTLGSSPDYINEETVKAIKEYQDKGGKFVVCTGRLLCSIRNILCKYRLKGDVIACQGSVIGDIESGKISYLNGIDHNLSYEIVKRLEDDGEYVLLDFDDRLCYNVSSKYTDMYEKLSSLSGKEIKKLSEFVLEKKTIIQKIMVMCEEQRVYEIINKYQKEYNGRLLFNSGSKSLVEIVNPKCNKGISTGMLASQYKIDKKDIMVIGDSLNDTSLMEYGYYGVAVGNACNELKEKANEVTVDFKDNPVLKMLKKYCL